MPRAVRQISDVLGLPVFCLFVAWLPAVARAECAGALAEVGNLGTVPNTARATAGNRTPPRGRLALSGLLSRGVVPASVRERWRSPPQRTRIARTASPPVHRGAGRRGRRRGRGVGACPPRRVRRTDATALPASPRPSRAAAPGSTRRSTGPPGQRVSPTPGSPGPWAIRRSILTDHVDVLADADDAWPVMTPHTTADRGAPARAGKPWHVDQAWWAAPAAPRPARRRPASGLPGMRGGRR